MQTTTKKVKEGTKGQKQIVTENQNTLSFYRKIMYAVSAVYFAVMTVFSTFSGSDIFFVLLTLLCYSGSYQFMNQMAKPKYSDSGQLIDSGIDLNMEGGIAEHFKDLIIVTAACQVLSLYSNYFWFLWLLVPVRGFWLLWKNILKPYFFQESPVNPEVDEKKQRKMERRMRRQMAH